MDTSKKEFLRRVQLSLENKGCFNAGNAYMTWEKRDLEGRYRPLRLIGEGSLKECWIAEDLICSRQVALLICKSTEAAAILRFKQEIDLFSSLHHEGVAMLHDAGLNLAGHMFYVAEFLDGNSLSSMLKQRLKAEDALSFAKQLIEVIAYAHRQGVYHLDLKPENIRVSPQGRIKVTDWEMGIHVDHVAMRGMIRGTSGYMPSAGFQRSPNFTPASADLHALGIIFLELLTDYRVEEASISVQAALHKLDPGLKAILQGCLGEDKSPYRDLADMQRDWMSWASGHAPWVERAGFWRKCRLFAARNRKMSFQLSAGALILLASFAWYTRHEQLNKQSLIAAMNREALEKSRRLQLIYDNREVMLDQISKNYLAGDMRQASEYLKLLEPVADKVDSWPLWELRIRIHGSPYQPGDLALLQSQGSYLERTLAGYLGHSPEIPMEKLLRCLAWLPGPENLQLLLTALAQQESITPAAQQIIKQLDEVYPATFHDLALMLRDANLVPEIEEELWRQMKTNATRSRNPNRRTDCELAQQLALARKRLPDANFFRDLIPANLALGSVARSDGHDARSPLNAVNGITANEDYWDAARCPVTLTLDFTRTIEFSTIKIFFYNSPGRIYKYRLWTSNDPKIPPEAIGGERESQNSEEPDIIHLDERIHARYLHLEVIHNSVNTSAHVREIEVYR